MDTGAARTDVRRAVVVLTISSFSIAALMGITALLRPGEFGETGVRVLLTTVLVGCASVVTLSCLVVVGGLFEPVGVVGFLAAVATSALGLFLVWSGSEHLSEHFYEAFGVGITASLTLAQISLLLGLAGARRSLAPVMRTTVVLAIVVASLVSTLITGYQPSGAFLRTLGVVAILDVLGTVVTIAVGVLGRDEDAITVSVSPALADRLREESRQTGRPVGDLVDDALERYLELPLA